MARRPRHTPEIPDEEDGTVSKSARKREMQALQELGEKLVELKESQLVTIPVDDKLLDAIRLARRLTQREAKRRQLQYIGKLMRQVDLAEVQYAYDRTQSDSLVAKNELHRLEHWRDRLIDEGDAAVGDCLEAFPEADAQQLRQLLRECRREREIGAPPAHSRKLFRYLKSVMT